MNQLAVSVDVGHGNYSTLIDQVKPKNGNKKGEISMTSSKAKFKKRMFAKVKINEDNQQIDELRQQLLEGGATKKTLNKSFLEGTDKEKQCLQLSERGNLWIILALLAGICYAFNNFFLGQLSHHGLVAVIYVNIPSFILFMIVYMVNMVRNKVIHGFYWSREISIFFKEEDNTIDWVNVLGVFLMSFCKFCGFCLVVMTFHYANQAGMNLGIITVIFNFCCITDSVVFYFVFNEKLSRAQLVGSGVLLLSAFFIAQKPSGEEDGMQSYGKFPNETELDFFERVQRIHKDHYYNAMMGITTALACTVFFSARDVILRYYKVTKNYPAFELSLDSLTLYSFGCTIYAVYMFGFQEYEFDWGSLSAGCMSAVLNTLGFMMLGISVVIGYAGPANALNSIQAIVLTFLSVMIMNQIPSQMQVTGMLLGMCGTIIVSVGDAIVKQFTSCYRMIRGAVLEEDLDESQFNGDYEKLKN